MELKDFRLISKKMGMKKKIYTAKWYRNDINSIFWFIIFSRLIRRGKKYFYVEILRLVPSPLAFIFFLFFARLKFEEIDKRTYHSKIIINSMKNNRGKLDFSLFYGEWHGRSEKFCNLFFFLVCCFFIRSLFYSFCHILLLKPQLLRKRAVYLPTYNEYIRIEFISSEKKRGKKLRNVVEKKLKLIHSFIAL